MIRIDRNNKINRKINANKRLNIIEEKEKYYRLGGKEKVKLFSRGINALIDAIDAFDLLRPVSYIL